MELEIFWSQFAENKLQDIFDYYKIKAGKSTAKKIVKQIVDRTLDLNLNPRIGSVEQLLEDRTQEFRYLVVTNYKIIYYLNTNKNRIIIANVFDTRQNPEKLQNTL